VESIALLLWKPAVYVWEFAVVFLDAFAARDVSLLRITANRMEDTLLADTKRGEKGVVIYGSNCCE
jgi:hypothetical protein